MTRGTRLPALGLVLAVALVYANGLAGPFLFDDFPAIVDNPQFRSDPLAAPFSAPDESTLAGRPIVTATFALNYALGGADVVGYHLVNVGIHALCALLLFGVVRRTLAAPPIVESFGEAADKIGFAVALIWALHPLCTEAVNYIVQRTESLMALFYLLTLYAVARAGVSARPWRFIALAASACALGMGTKEAMVTCPFVALLYDRIYQPDPSGSRRVERRVLYGALAASYLPLALLMTAGPRAESVGFTLGVDSWTYLGNQAVVLVDYLSHVFVPSRLVFDYGYPRELPFESVLPAAATIALLLAASIVALLRRPPAGFPAFSFFVLLAPTSSFVPIVTEVGAERRLYLPLAAAVALLVPLAYRLIGRLTGDRAGAVRVVALILAAVSLGSATVRRNVDYRTAESIWRSAIRARPENPRAHNGLGRVLHRSSRLVQAEVSYRRALAIETDFYQAQYNLGLVQAELGRDGEALEHFRRASRLQPGRAEPHYRQAGLLAAAGRSEESIAELREAVRLDPRLAEAHNDLGNALVTAGRLDDAVRHLERATSLQPDWALAHYNLALALAAAGDAEGAIRHNLESLRIHPDQPLAHNNLGTLHQAAGRLDEAIRCYREALAIDPTAMEPRSNLALALAARAEGQ